MRALSYAVVMTQLIITGVSSIACADAGALSYATPTRARSVSRCHPTKRELAQPIHLPVGCTNPVELLSDMHAPRHRSKQWVTRRARGPLPPHSLLRLDDQVYMTTPEFFFLKRARRLSIPQALLLAMELCGGYSTLYSISYQRLVQKRIDEDPVAPSAVFPPNEWGLDGTQTFCLMENGYVERPPLTSAAKLGRYLQKAPGNVRRSTARRVVDLIQDGSRSPGETRMYLLACLPQRYGGKRLAVPELNLRIPVTREAARLTRARYYVADMCWPEAKAIAEYDGRVHSDDTRRLYDDERRLALMAMGYEVLVLDRKSLRDDAKMDAFVTKVAARIGQNLYAPKNPEKCIVNQRMLRRDLFDYSFDLYRTVAR